MNIDKKIKSSFVVYGTLVLFLYCLIPFESKNVSDSLTIRMVSAFFLTLIAVTYFGNVPKKLMPVLIFLFGIILLVLLKSFSLKFFSTLVAILFGMFCASAIAGSLKYRRNFVISLKLLLYVSIYLLFFQIFWHHLTDNILKLHEVIFPISASRVEEHEYFNRLGGIFIEPGTHANWVYSFFLLYIYIEGKLDIKMGFLVGLSLISTISLWGAIVGSLLILICILNFYKVKNIVSSIIISFFVISIFYAFLNSDIFIFLENKLVSDGGSKFSKIDAWNEFFKVYSDIVFLGYGFNPNFCVGCVSPQDAGLILSLFVIFGIIPGMLIFVLIYYGSFEIGGFYLLIITLPLTFAKLFYWDYIFWIIFFVVLLQKNIKLNNHFFQVQNIRNHNKNTKI
jgi:hypothetical protein